MSGRYARPPILEAVMEFAYPELPASTIHRAAVKEKAFGRSQNDVNIKAAIKVTADRDKVTAENVSIDRSFVGRRLTSDDQRHILLIRPKTFGYVELAPYSGWEVFSASARKYWERFQKTAGRLKVMRIGLRYINRIDVP